MILGEIMEISGLIIIIVTDVCTPYKNIYFAIHVISHVQLRWIKYVTLHLNPTITWFCSTAKNHDFGLNVSFGIFCIFSKIWLLLFTWMACNRNQVDAMSVTFTIGKIVAQMCSINTDDLTARLDFDVAPDNLGVPK